MCAEKGFEKTDIIDKSEKFFDICDERRALRKPIRKSARPLWRFWSRYITADIVVLMMLIGY